MLALIEQGINIREVYELPSKAECEILGGDVDATECHVFIDESHRSHQVEFGRKENLGALVEDFCNDLEPSMVKARSQWNECWMGETHEAHMDDFAYYQRQEVPPSITRCHCRPSWVTLIYRYLVLSGSKISSCPRSLVGVGDVHDAESHALHPIQEEQST